MNRTHPRMTPAPTPPPASARSTANTPTMTALVAFAVLAAGLGGCSTTLAPGMTFGEPMKLSADDTLPVGAVVANPAAYSGRYVRIAGTVDQVCEASGCWMTLKDPATGGEVFVKFVCPIEGRLIPMEARGHNAIVEGNLEVETITEDDARHYAKDAGATDDEIAKIVGPQQQVSIKAPAAKIAM